MEADYEGGAAADVVRLGAAGGYSTKDLFPVDRAKGAKCRQGIAARHLRGDTGVVRGQWMRAFLDYQFVNGCEEQGWSLLSRWSRPYQLEQRLILRNPNSEPLVQWGVPGTLGRGEAQKRLAQLVDLH
jgi:hypothetical protein